MRRQGKLGRASSASTLDTGVARSQTAGAKTTGNRFGTIQSRCNDSFRGDYKGISLKEVVGMYGTKSDGGFGVRGYKVPKQPEKEPIS